MDQRGRWLFLALIVAGALTFSAQPGWSQKRGSTGAGAGDTKSGKKTGKKKTRSGKRKYVDDYDAEGSAHEAVHVKGRKVFRLSAIKIEGRIQKPTAFHSMSQAPVPAPTLPAAAPSEIAEAFALTNDLARIDEIRFEHHRRLRARAERLGTIEQLEESFEAPWRAWEQVTSATLGLAIGRIETYLRAHQPDPVASPELLYLLARLYFDQALLAYELAVQAAEESGNFDGLPSGVAYAPATTALRRILTDFPNYVHTDAVAYLLAYLTDASGERDKARQLYLELVCANRTAASSGTTQSAVGPKCIAKTSDRAFLVAAWYAIADADFDNNDLAAAAAGYQQVLTLAAKSSSHHDAALYKLGWTRYRLDRFADAVASFDALVVDSDDRVARGQPAIESRAEAIRWTALSLIDASITDPQLSALARAKLVYAGRFDRPHVREVLSQIGSIQADMTDVEAAIEAWRAALSWAPNHPDNPRCHALIVRSLELNRDFDAAARERAVFAERYAEGAPWSTANRGGSAARESLAAARAVLARTRPSNDDRSDSSPPDIDRSLSRQLRTIRRCVERHRNSKGRGILHIGVAFDGRVEQVEVTGLGHEISQCIAKQVRRWRFPNADMRSRVTIPLILTQSD